jgi:FkbH-like protein
VTLQSGQSATRADLKEFLEKRLPHYMVPSFIHVLEALPLTPNGKVDRKGLGVREVASSGTREVVEPRTETEARLLEIWKAVLPVKDFGVTNNFFDLGGHSLLAIRIVAAVRDIFGIELPLFTIFDTPTIESLGRQIDDGKWASGEQRVSVIRRVPREQLIPASFVQERLWFLDQLNPGSDAYNVPVALRLKGKLDFNRLEDAYHNVIRRHETLRTTFAFEDAALVQRIAAELKPGIEVTDLSTGSDGESMLTQLLAQTSSRPFDLATGPLVRAHLFKLGEEEHVLVFAMHHTISDGWSLALMFKELEAFYVSGAEKDELAGVPSLPVQYADYAVWQRETMNGSALDGELAYWRESMQGAPAQIEFPCAQTTQTVSANVERLKEEFPAAFVKALGRKAQETGATPFAILMSALAITLSKWTGQQDLVIGTVVAGRSRRETEHLIGCFMNFLPIRTRVEPNASADKFLKDVRNRVLEAQSHQDCPFEKIVEALNPARKGDSNPLYNVALLWQNFPHDLFEGEGLETELVPVAPTSALLDLRFEAEQLGDAISIICEFRHGKFDAGTIEKLLASLRATMEALVNGSVARIGDIQIDSALTASRKPEVRAKRDTLALSGTFTIEPLRESLQHWIGELAMNMEVEFAPYNQVFQELLNPSSALGSNQAGANVTLVRLEDWIRDKAGSESAAKADIQRNLEELVRALKEFAARNSTPHIVCTCPPSARIQGSFARTILEHCEEVLNREIGALPSVHFLSAKQVLEWYPVADYNDSASDELGHVPYTPLFFTALGTAITRKLHAIKRAPAKVIVLDCDHTIWSGVCGEDGAKGVIVDGPWKDLQEFMRRKRESGMLLALCSKNNPEDVEEVFSKRHEMPLRRDHFAAVRLNWLPKSENLRSIAAELNLGLDSFVFLDDNPVECAEVEAGCPEVLTLQLPEDASIMAQFVRHCWVFDQAKLTVEDKKRAEMYRQNSERERLRTQSSGLADFIASLDLKVTIGKMSDAEMSRVAQLTQRTNQFNMSTRRRTEAEVRKLQPGAEVLSVQVSDRFGDYGLVGVVIYRTSGESLDVDTFLLSCRVLGRGVEHKMLGRLGEVARELKLNWVNLHYAPTAKNKPALNFLESTAGSFKQHVNGGLLFRLPAGFASEVTFNIQSVPMEALAPSETAANAPAGQEKFRACRAIALKSRDIAEVHKRIEAGPGTRRPLRDTGAAPETQMERQLSEIWAKLLKREDIGVNDNFFDLGGHSLLAVRLFAEIGRVTGKKLPLVTLFQAPTIRELARVLQRDKDKKPAGPEALLVPIQPGGDLPPLFLVHGAGGDVLWGYANLAAHMVADRPIYGIKSRGQVGLEECKTITEMAKAYVEAIQTRQKHGPYYLGGYCFGGNVAYEMARLFEAQGEQVAMVALLDSSPSNAGYEDTHWTSPKFAWRFSRNALYWLLDFARQPLKVQAQFVSRKGRVVGRKLRDRFVGKSSGKVDLEEIIDLNHFPEHELRLWQTHIQALVEHTDQPYDGSVVLFRTRGQPVFCSFEDDFCWGKLARKGVRIVRIPGAHENIFMEPNVKMLAQALSRALAGEERTARRTSPGEAVNV